MVEGGDPFDQSPSKKKRKAIMLSGLEFRLNHKFDVVAVSD